MTTDNHSFSYTVWPNDPTVQELFNESWRGMKTQGFQPASNPATGTCSYLVTDGDKRCAIGHLMTKDEAVTAYGTFNTMMIEQLLPQRLAALTQQSMTFGSLLGAELQQCHDSAVASCRNPEDQSKIPYIIEENMRRFAANNNLTIPE